jgi:hypothetical protein
VAIAIVSRRDSCERCSSFATELPERDCAVVWVLMV